MCLTNEAVDELHAITSAIKAEQSQRDQWLAIFDKLGHLDGRGDLELTRAEAEQIFAQRIAAHEAKLKELGWSKTTRVEPKPEASK